jgi:dipeptide/tripeptide permease
MTRQIVPSPHPHPSRILVAKSAAIGILVGSVLGTILDGTVASLVEWSIIGGACAAGIAATPVLVHALKPRLIPTVEPGAIHEPQQSNP